MCHFNYKYFILLFKNFVTFLITFILYSFLILHLLLYFLYHIKLRKIRISAFPSICIDDALTCSCFDIEMIRFVAPISLMQNISHHLLIVFTLYLCLYLFQINSCLFNIFLVFSLLND